MFKRKKINYVNLWELVPQRRFSHEILDNNNVVILIPKFTSRFMSKYVMPRLKHPFIKIKLDEIGSTVWLEIDGEKSVGEIAKILEARFGEKIQPIEERLAKFFTNLSVHNFITFKNKEESHD